MKSGQSFNYFNGNGEVGVDTTLDFEPLVGTLAVARDKFDVVKDAMPPVRKIGVTQVAAGSLENKLFAGNA